MIVLDTNVIAELMRDGSNERVLRWAEALSPSEHATTAITVAEIRYGIERLPEGRRKAELGTAASKALRGYRNRIFAFDEQAAEGYALLVVVRQRAGAPTAQSDAQIAGICLSRGLLLATRNTADFTGLGLELVNPWTSEESS